MEELKKRRHRTEDEEEEVGEGEEEQEGGGSDESDEEEEEGEPRYEGAIDEEGDPHGIGYLHFSDGSRMGGMWVHGSLHGAGEYVFADGSSLAGKWDHGELTGEVEEFLADGRLLFRGEYRDGKRHGRGVLRYPDEGTRIEGRWHEGLLTGEATYYYPDGSSLRGTWDDSGDLKSAVWYDQQGQIDPKHRSFPFIGVKEDDQLDDDDDDHDDDNEEKEYQSVDDGQEDEGRSMRSSTGDVKGTGRGLMFTTPYALIPDPYEEQYVYVDESRIPGSGQGLFAKRHIAKDTIFSFYAGEKITHEQNDRRLWSACGNAISLDENLVIDVPPPFDRTEHYCASLGHKANHATPPENNCIYYPFHSHPVFGRIKCLRSIRPIAPGEELLTDYGYEAHDAPDWWTSSGRKRKSPEANDDRSVAEEKGGDGETTKRTKGEDHTTPTQ